jgi:hypothetical protein
VAEDAKVEMSREPRRRGPQKEVLSPVLFDKLVECYQGMFGDLPVMNQENAINGNRYPAGPVLKWLRDLLELARDRLGPRAVKSAKEVRDDITGELRRRLCVATDAAERMDLEERIEDLKREGATAAQGETVQLLSGRPHADITAGDELKYAVAALLEIPPEVLGTRFERAIRRVKHRAATQVQDPRNPSPGG